MLRKCVSPAQRSANTTKTIFNIKFSDPTFSSIWISRQIQIIWFWCVKLALESLKALKW